MAITLLEARDILKDSILHVGNTSWSDREIDDAIKYSYSRFNLECNAVTQIVAIPTLSNDDDIIDLSAETGLADFHRDQVLMIYDFTDSDAPRLLEPTVFRSLLRKRLGNGTNADPTHYAFPDDKNIYIYPQSDGGQDLMMVRRKPLFAFASGSVGAWADATTYFGGQAVSYTTNSYRCTSTHLGPGDASTRPDTGTNWTLIGTTTTMPIVDPTTQTFELNDEWLQRLLYTGGRYSVLMGIPGAPEWPEAKKDFEAMIAEGKSTFMDTDGPVNDRQTAPSSAPRSE